MSKFKSEKQRKAVMAKMKNKKPKVYKTNPTRTVDEYKKKVEETERKRQKELEERKERRMEQKRKKGERRYYTKSGLRTEHNIEGKKNPFPESRQLKRLGYEPINGFIRTENKKEAYKRFGREGFQLKFVKVGKGLHQPYKKPFERKERDYQERDQYGIIKKEPKKIEPKRMSFKEVERLLQEHKQKYKR